MKAAFTPGTTFAGYRVESLSDAAGWASSTEPPTCRWSVRWR